MRKIFSNPKIQNLLESLLGLLLLLALLLFFYFCTLFTVPIEG